MKSRMQGLLFIACYFLSWSFVAWGAELRLEGIEVTFFNVGQGNCTVIGVPNGPAFLIDGGSTWLPGDALTIKNEFKKQKIKEITRRIQECLPSKVKDKDIELNVIVSHGDKDHYNWIPQIISGLHPKPNIQFLLGGKSQEYSDSFLKFIKEYEPKTVPIYTATHNDKLPDFTYGDVKGIILAAQRDTTDTNYKSIVLKVSYGSKSLILTGDATGKTTDAILETYKNNLDILQATVLQISHHGADSENTNDQKWLEAVKPEYVVFSAGMREDYLHPKAIIMDRVLGVYKPKNFLRDGQLPHNLKLHRKLPLYDYHRIGNPLLKQFKGYGLYDSGYSLTATTLGAYSTLDQGNIIFSWTPDKNSNVGVLCETSGKAGKTFKEFILGNIANKTETQDIISLNLANLEITHEDLEQIAPKFPTSLTSLSLASNPQLIDTTKLSNLLAKFTQIRELDLEGIPFKNQVPILEAWNHRGLLMDKPQ